MGAIRARRGFQSLAKLAYRAVPYIYRGYNTYTRLRQRYGGGRGSTMTRRNGVRSNAITHQHDVRKVYQRKRMPYRKKKQWVRFVRKVKAVQLKTHGKRHVVLNDSSGVSIASNVQGYGSFVVYGITGSGTGGHNDMTRIAAADSANFGVASKVHFNSAVLDLTFSNVGGESASTIELDIYEFYYRRTNNFANMTDLALNLLATSPNIGAGLSLTTVGTTFFQVPQLGEYVRITKKTKFFVPIDDQMTYQMRDPGNKVFNTQDFVTDGTVNESGKRGWTKGIAFIAKGVPTLASGAGAIEYAWGVTRTYSYSVIQSQSAADGVA